MAPGRDNKSTQQGKSSASGNTANTGELLTTAEFKEQMQLMSQGLISKIDSIKEEINDIVANKIAEVTNYIDNEIKIMTRRIEDIEKKQVSNLMASEVNVNNEDCYIIVQGLKPTEKENTIARVGDLLDVMRCDVRVEDAVRIGAGTNNYCPLIKFRVPSKENARAVLRARFVLKDSDKYRKVYVRQSKPKWQRDIEANFKILMRGLPAHPAVRMNAHGRLYEDKDRHTQEDVVRSEDRQSGRRNPNQDREYNLRGQTHSHRYSNNYEYR